ncbi:hypothetical protein QN277_010348 [Acacia crassicarpa]|uniref:Transmembrane protein n=1 Tax=Acacia crassicarpa TaxID=499986 RepID=A0AAE1IMQ7_9FABA|nr:hypothetical protein QN277_010348 [Acacia crassicarpa]
MAPISTFKAFAVLLAIALFSAAASAELDSDMPPSPAPTLKVGAAGSVSSSVALVGASVVFSMLVILKNQGIRID